MSLSFIGCSFLIVASSLIDSSVGKQLPRGVSPEDAALYIKGASQGQFTCKDGSITIPFRRVNDDYCDCADGSDEPGVLVVTCISPSQQQGWFLFSRRFLILEYVRLQVQVPV